MQIWLIPFQANVKLCEILILYLMTLQKKKVYAF